MKHQNFYDIKIVNALQKLKLPIKKYDGNNVTFYTRKRGESIFEHIANKEHQLKLRDIEQIQEILGDKRSVHKDKKSSKFIVYYGKRKGQNKKGYLKIVTKISCDFSEQIITIYPVRRKE